MIMKDFAKDLEGSDPLNCVLEYLERSEATLIRALIKVSIVCGYSTARAIIDTACRRRLTPYKEGVLTLNTWFNELDNIWGLFSKDFWGFIYNYGMSFLLI